MDVACGQLVMLIIDVREISRPQFIGGLTKRIQTSARPRGRESSDLTWQTSREQCG